MPFVFVWILLEIIVFILVGKWIGVLWTILLIVLTTMIGLAILRTHTLSVMQKLQTAMKDGKPHQVMLSDTPLIMLGGILLVIPGFISDFLGLICLFFSLFMPKLKLNVNKKDDANVIDAEFWEEPKEKPQLDDKAKKNKEH